MAHIRTTAHIQSGDHLKATLNGDTLIVDIGDDLRVFCNKEHNPAIFEDMVEIFRPIVTLTEEKANDQEAE